MSKDQKSALFWKLAAPMLATGQAEKGTMMGYACLRSQGKFFASLERGSNNLIVKLPAARVAALINSGQARSFAPNGRVFREWAMVETTDEESWGALIVEAHGFVSGPA